MQDAFLWFTSITFKQTPSSENKLAIKVKKTKLMLTGSKTMLLLFDDIDLQMNGTQVEHVQSCKYLAVIMDEKWS